MTVEEERFYRHDITTRKFTRGLGRKKNFQVSVEEVNIRVEPGKVTLIIHFDDSAVDHELER